MAVFRRMDKNGDGHLDVDELHEVAAMLGEDIKKSEIKEMIKMPLGFHWGSSNMCQLFQGLTCGGP